MQINQAQFMRQFNETHREEFNPELFKRDNEEIVEAIRQVVMSCERDKYYTLKLLSFEAFLNSSDKQIHIYTSTDCWFSLIDKYLISDHRSCTSPASVHRSYNPSYLYNPRFSN